MKSFIAILLLFSWMVQAFLPSIIQQDALYSMRRKRQELAEQSESGGKVFKFKNEKEIKWTKLQKEFAISGIMYDVAEKWDSSGFIMIRAIEDGPELALLKKHNKLQRERQKQSNQMLKHWTLVLGLPPEHSIIKLEPELIKSDEVFKTWTLSDGHCKGNDRPPTPYHFV